MSLAVLNSLISPTDAQVEQFRRAGHTLIEGVLPQGATERYRVAIDQQAEVARAHAKPLAERSTYDRAFLQLMNLWRHDPLIAEFVLADRFAALAAALLGVEKVRLYHDQALYKEPGGGHTPWHQDAMYWPLDGQHCITMWMPLVDITPEMGAMVFAEGSQRNGSLGGNVISDASEAEYDALVANEGFTLSTPQPMRAGDATFHNGWTVHRASGNRTDTMRAVMTIIWFADGLTVEAPQRPEQHFDLAIWLPGCTVGGLAGSAFNPVLPAAPEF